MVTKFTDITNQSKEVKEESNEIITEEPTKIVNDEDMIEVEKIEVKKEEKPKKETPKKVEVKEQLTMSDFFEEFKI